MWDNKEHEISLKKESKLSVRKISPLKEFADLYAYCKYEYYNGVLIGKDEGIITQEGLVKFVERGSLKEYFNFNLVDVELMHKYLKDPSIRNLPEDCYIEKPYSQNIVIEDINKYAFIKDRIGLDGDIVDYIGTYHAVGVQMGYIKGNITDKEFDLKKLLEALKKREDIIFVNGAKIEPITCQYGYNEDEHETINFIWLPSEEDHEKCIDYYGNFNVYDAPEKVFGVKRYNNYVI